MSFRNIEKDITTKCRQIDNTVCEGFFTTDELYELSAKAGEQTIEKIKEYKKMKEGEMKRRDAIIEKGGESFELKTKNLREMKNKIKDKVDYIDEKNKMNKELQKQLKKSKELQKQLKIEKELTERELRSIKDIGTAEAMNLAERKDIARYMTQGEV